MKKRIFYIIFFMSLFNIISITYGGNIPNLILTEVLPENIDNYNFRGGIACNGEYYLLVTGDSGEVYRSSDGIEWEHISSIHKYIRQMIWDGKQFIVLCDAELHHDKNYERTISSCYIATSTDGLLWEYIPTPNIGNEYIFEPYDIEYTGKIYCFTGDMMPSSFEYSRDGYMHASVGCFFYSYDLKNFIRCKEDNLIKMAWGTRPLKDILWNGKILLGVGNGSDISKDGKTWTGKFYNQKGASYGNTEIIWDGSKFVDASFRYTYNGGTWFEPKGMESIWGNLAIAYNGKDYVVMGEKDKNNVVFYHSKDGLKWKKYKFSIADTYINRIQKTKNGFILLGNKIFYLNFDKLNSEKTINMKDTINLYWNNKSLEYGGAVKLRNSIYIPLRSLIKNNLITVTIENKSYYLKLFNSNLSSNINFEDTVNVNNRAYIDVTLLCKALNFDYIYQDNNLYLIENKKLDMNDLEKGKLM